jgi:hypothetical protein
MKIILSIIIAALLLAYYLRSDWENIKHNRILMGALVGGTLIFYLGLTFSSINPAYESLLKLTGACIFFTGVALHTVKRPQAKDPDQNLDQDEDNP